MLNKMSNHNLMVVEQLPIDTIIGEKYSINQTTPNNYTHGLFKYPCKFIPEVPRWAMRKYVSGSSTIFDPFSGSGTTLLEAIIQGHSAYGTEIDLVAKKLIRAKTYKYTKQDLCDIDDGYRLILRTLKNPESPISYAKINNLDHWFVKENADDLGRIKAVLPVIYNENARNFLEIVFLSIIKQTSQADDISPKPYVSSKFIKKAPKVIDKFKFTYDKYREMLQNFYELNTVNRAILVDGDALCTKSDFVCDLAITSPPYINAFDYSRTLRLENLWAETHTEESILQSKRLYVGTENFVISDSLQNDITILEKSELLKEIFLSILQVDKRRAYVIKKFFEDMERNLINVHRHLKTNSKYVIVIGNSMIRQHIIESWKIILDISIFNKFKYVEHFSYVIHNPYIRIPRKGRGGLIKEDIVLVLEKI